MTLPAFGNVNSSAGDSDGNACDSIASASNLDIVPVMSLPLPVISIVVPVTSLVMPMTSLQVPVMLMLVPVMSMLCRLC